MFVIFSSSGCIVQDRHSRKLIGTGGLYVLEHLSIPPSLSRVHSSALSAFHLKKQLTLFDFWHSRLGHVSSSRLKYMLSAGLLGSVPYSDISDCKGCKLAKFSALPFNKSTTVSSAPFDLIHSSVWGPSPVVSIFGFR